MKEHFRTRWTEKYKTNVRQRAVIRSSPWDELRRPSFDDCSLTWAPCLTSAWPNGCRTTRGGAKRPHQGRRPAPRAGGLPGRRSERYELLCALRRHRDEGSVGSDASRRALDDENCATWSYRWPGWRSSARTAADQWPAVNNKPLITHETACRRPPSPLLKSEILIHSEP